MKRVDFSLATEKDVPTIVRTIEALRNMTRVSKVSTTRTQSELLRTVPDYLLPQVALELEKLPANSEGR